MTNEYAGSEGGSDATNQAFNWRTAPASQVLSFYQQLLSQAQNPQGMGASPRDYPGIAQGLQAIVNQIQGLAAARPDMASQLAVPPSLTQALAQFSGRPQNTAGTAAGINNQTAAGQTGAGAGATGAGATTQSTGSAAGSASGDPYAAFKAAYKTAFNGVDITQAQLSDPGYLAQLSNDLFRLMPLDAQASIAQTNAPRLAQLDNDDLLAVLRYNPHAIGLLSADRLSSLPTNYLLTEAVPYLKDPAHQNLDLANQLTTAANAANGGAASGAGAGAGAAGGASAGGTSGGGAAGTGAGTGTGGGAGAGAGAGGATPPTLGAPTGLNEKPVGSTANFRSIADITAQGGIGAMTPQEADYYLGGLPGKPFTGSINDAQTNAFLNATGVNTNSAAPWLNAAAAMVPGAALSGMLGIENQGGVPSASQSQDVGLAAQAALAKGNLSTMTPEEGRAFLNQVVGRQDTLANGGQLAGTQDTLNTFLNDPNNFWNAMNATEYSGLAPDMRAALDQTKARLQNQWMQQGNKVDPVTGQQVSGSQSFGKFLQGAGYFG